MRGARRKARPTAPGLRRIFVVFKTHFDMGFTGLLHEVLHTYSHLLVPQALEACRRTLENGPGHLYVWTLPAWPLTYALKVLQGSTQGEELDQRAREGLIAWHALPLTTHTELFGLEDIIRGLYVARRLGERFGRSAVAAKMTDVPGHTWILPSLLASAGISFLHLGCNPCSTPPDVPLLFHWEGPDGSRVTTMYSRGGYGTGLFPPPEWKLPVWLALRQTADNVGPQRAEVVQEILRAVHERSPGTEVSFGTLDDFARALAGSARNLPVVRKDLADSWIHGVGSMPAEVAILRSARNQLVQLESARALRKLGPAGAGREDDWISASLASAYEKILLFGEHTWGMDTKLALNPPEFGGRVYDKEQFREIRASGKYERIQRSWDDKRKLAADAYQIVRDIASRLAASGAEGSVPGGFEVFNHHLWEWNGPVRLGRISEGVAVSSESTGEVVPAFRLDGEVWVRVVVPPLGCLRLHVRESDGSRASGRYAAAIRKKANLLTLENGRVRVRVDRSGGGIRAISDLQTGREWVDGSRGVPFGAYRYDVYSRREIAAYLKSYAYDLEHWFLDDFGKPGYPDRFHETDTGELVRIEEQRGAGWARLRLVWRQDARSVRDLGNPAEVVQSITLLADQPWVDLHYLLAGTDECPLLEAGHVVMPFSCARPRYAINKTGSVVDPASDIARDANRLLYCCDRWVDVTDGETGMLVIPFDSPLFSIGLPAIERFDGSALPGESILFFNLFNTQWGTNFPQWIGGDLSFRFRLVPHAGDWRKARAWEVAAAALQPPLCLPASSAVPPAVGRPAGLLARAVPGLETVTLKTCETGDGLILRLRETSGRAGKRTLRFRLPPSSPAPRIILCSLLEEEEKSLPLARSGNCVDAVLSVRPFQVVTLKIML